MAWLAAVLCALAPGLVAGDPAVPSIPVLDLLRQFIATGINVVYSSELVPPTLTAPDFDRARPLVSRLAAALAANGLQLKRTAEKTYLVVRAPQAPDPTPAAVPAAASGAAAVRPVALDQISVFASRYEFTAMTDGEPVGYDQRAIEEMPGAQTDAVRALRAAPGFATNLSARPYVRGALIDDVLVEFDGIALADPYHFRNFERVMSVFDPASVSRADVYTGGFPVNYGTRSGGVIDLTPAALPAGYEVGVGASLLSYNLESVGHAEGLPLEWLLVARTSSDDSVLERLISETGEPAFNDVVGRLRWHVDDASAVTWGLLKQEDRVTFDSDVPDQHASGDSLDVTTWLRWDWKPHPELQGSGSVALADMRQASRGSLALPGIAAGSLGTQRDFTSLTVRSDWQVSDGPLRWTFGGEFARENADLHFDRQEMFSASVAASFDRPTRTVLDYNQSPHSYTAGWYGALDRRWQDFEAEVGLRVDAQDYFGYGTRSQLTPRVNLRYDFAADWHGYASWGQFTQAQRVDEYRTESGQIAPDSANRATHVIAGASYQADASTTLRIEAYRHHWASISPYFDNILGNFSVLPQLGPDRVLVVPGDADAAGLELSAQRSFGHLNAWGSYTFSHVTDDSGASEVVRSWDQPHALNLGVAWTRRRTEASAMLAWHSGWPKTPVGFAAATASSPASLLLGPRNSERWNSFFSLDLRVATAIPLRGGELTLWADGTNVTNRANDCCTELASMSASTGPPAMATTAWAPRVLNVGFVFRVKHPD